MTDKLLADDPMTALMAQLRPRLHRYCARIVGSVFDGEDVVQEALAKATEALPSAGRIESLERWLFTIAHNTALDALRRQKRHSEVSIDEDIDASSPSDTEAWMATTASIATLMQLPVIQRSSVVLIDVLEYSAEEAAQILDSTVLAVKAALHRGRLRLRNLSAEPEPHTIQLSVEELARLRAYAESFNARDFETLRNLLAEDAKLDLVNRRRLSGRKDVSVYFGRYGESHDWKFSVGLAENRPALIVSDPEDASNKPTYVVLLEWRDGTILNIRDFRWAEYITDGMICKKL